MRTSVPHFGCLIPYFNWYGVIQTLDHENMTAELKLFKTVEEADEAVHNYILIQFPELHKENCVWCKERKVSE